MDAFTRRLNLFKSELIDDITTLNGLIETEDFIAIKEFTHKYKMRLTYFKYDEALSLCKQIEQIDEQKESDLAINKANEFLSVLHKIQIELKDESFSG